MKTKIILEIGSNWHSLDDIKRSIDFARSVGALSKLQLWNTSKFVRRSNKNYDIYKKYEIPKDWVRILDADDVFYSVFDSDSLLFLKTEINPNYYKISALDSNQKWLIDSIARTNKKCFMSCGVYGLDSVRQAVKWYGDCGNIMNLTLMHTIVSYEKHDFNLNYFRDRVIGSKIIPWGCSFNFPNEVLPAVAVGIGASSCEIHFRLDHIRNTPDTNHSLTPKRLNSVIDNIKIVEDNMGNCERPIQCELENIKIGRRKIDNKR